jgi:hypothetical protein
MAWTLRGGCRPVPLEFNLVVACADLIFQVRRGPIDAADYERFRREEGKCAWRHVA